MDLNCKLNFKKDNRNKRSCISLWYIHPWVHCSSIHYLKYSVLKLSNNEYNKAKVYLILI